MLLENCCVPQQQWFVLDMLRRDPGRERLVTADVVVLGASEHFSVSQIR